MFKELFCQQKEEFPFFYSASHSVWTDLTHEEDVVKVFCQEGK